MKVSLLLCLVFLLQLTNGHCASSSEPDSVAVKKVVLIYCRSKVNDPTCYYDNLEHVITEVSCKIDSEKIPNAIFKSDLNKTLIMKLPPKQDCRDFINSWNLQNTYLSEKPTAFIYTKFWDIVEISNVISIQDSNIEFRISSF